MSLPPSTPSPQPAPLRMPLPDALYVAFMVYFRLPSASAPTPSSLVPVVDAWLERHCPPPLLSAVAPLTVPPEQGFGTGNVQTAGAANVNDSTLSLEPAWKYRYFRPISRPGLTG